MGTRGGDAWGGRCGVTRDTASLTLPASPFPCTGVRLGRGLAQRPPRLRRRAAARRAAERVHLGGARPPLDREGREEGREEEDDGCGERREGLGGGGEDRAARHAALRAVWRRGASDPRDDLPRAARDLGEGTALEVGGRPRRQPVRDGDVGPGVAADARGAPLDRAAVWRDDLLPAPPPHTPRRGGQEGAREERWGGGHRSHSPFTRVQRRSSPTPRLATAHRRAPLRARLLPFRLRHARLPPHRSRSGDGPGHSHTLPPRHSHPPPATPTSHPISSASVSIRSPTRRRASSATSRPECSSPRRCRSPSRARARRSARSTCRRVVPPPPPQHHHHLHLLHHHHHLHHLPSP